MQAFTVGKQWLSMRIMAELLRHNRAPTEVMLVLAAEEAHLQQTFAKTGRNEPCLCGNGRTFKHCCGRSMRCLCTTHFILSGRNPEEPPNLSPMGNGLLVRYRLY